MDRALIRTLLQQAEATNAPEFIQDEFGEREFVTPDGWKVVLFYDCGELDYIDHMISPDGERFSPWSEEDQRIFYADFEWSPLHNWRSVGDIDECIRSMDYGRFNDEAA